MITYYVSMAYDTIRREWAREEDLSRDKQKCKARTVVGGGCTDFVARLKPLDLLPYIPFETERRPKSGQETPNSWVLITLFPHITLKKCF